jgi:prepilin-type N-terminal cleavage/methylation domain-containing protein
MTVEIPLVHADNLPPVSVSFSAPSSTRRARCAERGFTLIELLTVIVLLGILAALSVQGFVIYKASAAFAVATSTLRDAQTALYAAQTAPNATFSSVDTSQRAQGALATAEGREIFPGFVLPKSVDFAYAYDPTCVDGSCPYQTRVEVRHVAGQKYLRWIRFGDGVEARLEVPGAGYGP